jgi:putative nucleotidyltransferase with HDIG domain
MSTTDFNRAAAFRLLTAYNQDSALIKHALAVEGVMRHFARKLGGDEETWGICGMLHDLDYERFPNEHCTKSAEILRQERWPEIIIRAVVSHGWGVCSDVEPQSLMEKVLYAIDELTGLVTTTVLVRPSRSVLDVEARSVQKKWKDKRFAVGVDRAIIERGAQMLGMNLESLIADTITGMREVAQEIGLKGCLTPLE